MAKGVKLPQAVMTINEVAAYLRCHETTIYRMARRRAIPHFRVGVNYRFLLEQIDAWTLRKSLPGR
jgi:excisionase family DNA binding protein